MSVSLGPFVSSLNCSMILWISDWSSLLFCVFPPASPRLSSSPTILETSFSVSSGPEGAGTSDGWGFSAVESTYELVDCTGGGGAPESFCDPDVLDVGERDLSVSNRCESSVFSFGRVSRPNSATGDGSTCRSCSGADSMASVVPSWLVMEGVSFDVATITVSLSRPAESKALLSGCFTSTVGESEFDILEADNSGATLRDDITGGKVQTGQSGILWKMEALGSRHQLARKIHLGNKIWLSHGRIWRD